jgi:hypothetical protein
MITFTVGYIDPILGYTNVFRPTVVSTPSGVNVSISTLQEGGYFNSHFNSSAYFVTPLTQSIFVLKSARPVSFQLTWRSSGKDTTANFTATSNSSVLLMALKQSTVLKYVSSVQRYSHGSSLWEEYRVAFTTSLKKGKGQIYATTVTSSHTMSDDDLLVVSTLLDAENYPLFYDNRHMRGFSGSGRYVCTAVNECHSVLIVFWCEL